MKHKIITFIILILCILLLSNNVIAYQFVDIQNSDYRDAIDFLYKRGYINGRTSTKFYPDDLVTREEACKMIVVAGQFPISKENKQTYDDVPTDSFYYKYIQTAHRNNLIKGVGNHIFKPKSYITYIQALKIILNMLGYHINGNDWRGVVNLYKYKISYNANLKYDEYITRGQLAQIIYNGLNAYFVDNERNETPLKYSDKLNCGIDVDLNTIQIGSSNYGRLFIDSQKINVGLNISTYKYSNQDVTDLIDSAAIIFRGDNTIIADHVHQAFNKLPKCEIDDIAYLITPYDIKTLKLIDIIRNAKNTGMQLLADYGNGKSIEFMYRHKYMMYTCNNDLYNTVTVTIWEEK